MKTPDDLGMKVLAAWLILFGLLTAPFLKIQLRPQWRRAALLAIVAGSYS